MTERPSFRDGVQRVWDSTSLSLAMKCPKLYEYRMIRSIVSNQTKVDFLFGGLYASALEHFYKYRTEGATIDEALERVVRETLVKTWTPTGPVAFPHETKTRMNLIRTIVWYIDEFAEETEDTPKTHILQNGKPAVELSFTLEMSADILYAGHLDRVVDYGGGLYWMDQKAQPLDATVLTPTGFTPIRALSVGDYAMGVDGQIYTIEGIFPKGITSCYRVTTNDGVSTLAAGDHLWKVRGAQTKWRTLTTPELIGKKWELPTLAPMQFPRADLPLHPYALGLLIGDGYLAGHSIQFSDQDGAEATRLAQYLGTDKIKPSSIYNNSWTISGGKTLQAIKDLGLFGALSADKFIPHSYLYADIEQRSALLRGLIETDGCKNKNSQLYDTTSEQLAKDICQLARSLGNTARYRPCSGGAFRCMLFGPSFGHYARNPRIVSVERVEDAETACIRVSAADHLYITDNYIPTHNTTGKTLGQFYIDQFTPDNQFTGYTWAGKTILHSPIRGGIVDAAQIAVGFTRFARFFVSRGEDEIDEWISDVKETVRRTQEYTARGSFPRNRTACFNCEYRKLCSVPPRMRETFMQSDYHLAEHWEPAVPR